MGRPAAAPRGRPHAGGDPEHLALRRRSGTPSGRGRGSAAARWSRTVPSRTFRSVRPARAKKNHVADHPEVFGHVGLLAGGSPGPPGYPSSRHPTSADIIVRPGPANARSVLALLGDWQLVFSAPTRPTSPPSDSTAGEPTPRR